MREKIIDLYNKLKNKLKNVVSVILLFDFIHEKNQFE